MNKEDDMQKISNLKCYKKEKKYFLNKISAEFFSNKNNFFFQ